MNFAFVSVLLLFVSIPGIALRRSYYAGRFSLDYITTNLINEIVWSLIPAIVLHAIAILAIERISNINILLDNFGYLVSGGNEKSEVNQIFQNIHSYIPEIVSYNLGLALIAIIIGICLRLVIRYFSLDSRLEFLKFPNKWHYLFTGEYLNNAENGWKFHKNIGFIKVEVLMNLGQETVIYSGKLEDYFLRSGGGLDRIIIKYPSKKLFSLDGSTDFREIPGNYLTIPFEKILNINTEYYALGDEGEPDIISD